MRLFRSNIIVVRSLYFLFTIHSSISLNSLSNPYLVSALFLISISCSILRNLSIVSIILHSFLIMFSVKITN